MLMKNFLIFGLLMVRGIWASEALEKSSPENDIKINADSMEYDTAGKQADAKGNVSLTYKIKNTPIVLRCNNLHAVFNEDGSLANATAQGDVEIDHEDTKLFATKCIHDFKNNQAVCTGEDVKLIQKENEMHGKRATLDFPNQVFTMQSAEKQQISVTFYPKEKNKG